MAKLEVNLEDAEPVLGHVASIAPSLLERFSPQELSNTLWGLARLISNSIQPDAECLATHAGSNQRARQEHFKLAMLLVSQSAQHLDMFSDQCLSNSLWAVAKLDLRGRVPE